MTEPHPTRFDVHEHGTIVAPSDADARARGDHMANERTHLAYIRTAISLISLGITVNRFALYLEEKDALPAGPRVQLLHGTASAGLGMVIYALALMLIALYRYRAMDRAIDRGSFHEDRPIVELVTVTVIIGGAAGILWMFPR